MFDKELVCEILSQIFDSTQIVQKRFEPIESPVDFVSTEAGKEKLDSICMQLIAIGESLKTLDKITQNKLLRKYPGIEWKRVKGMRDIISHHYFDVDAEAIYDVCDKHIKDLAATIKKMRDELEA